MARLVKPVHPHDLDAPLGFEKKDNDLPGPTLGAETQGAHNAVWFGLAVGPAALGCELEQIEHLYVVGEEIVGQSLNLGVDLLVGDDLIHRALPAFAQPWIPQVMAGSRHMIS
jgi:hypothetical protein